MTGRVFVVSAPSGAGKTSLVEAAIPLVRKKYWIEQVITYTSKQPRHTDPKRKDFHFVAKTEFEDLIAKDFFLEWSDAYGAYYGTPRSILDDLAKGRSRILVIDRIGAQQVASKVKDVVLMWIVVNDTGVLRERLMRRGTESDQQIDSRLNLAQIEIDLEREKPFYTHHITNDMFEAALKDLTSIIIKELSL